jgi:hypothetical protein
MSQAPNNRTIGQIGSNSGDSWVNRLPMRLASGITAAVLIASQINTCDSVVTVANGDSLIFIVACFAIAFLVALDGVLQASSEPWQGVPWLQLICVLFCIWLWISTSLQAGHQNMRTAYFGCWQWIAQLLLLLSLLRIGREKNTARTLLIVMFACLAGTIAFAGFQYFVTMPNDRRLFSENPDSVLAELGIIPGSSDAILYANRIGSVEPTGPFILTNSLAGFLAVWLVVIVGLLLVSAKTKRVFLPFGPKLGTYLSVLGLASGVVLVLTNSRTAWLATLCGILLVVLVVPSVRRWLFEKTVHHRGVAVGMGLALCASLATVWVSKPNIVADAMKSLSYRFDYWRGATELAWFSPWIGQGACNFQANYNRVKSMMASESPADPHNFLFETLCAGGLPLLGLLVLGIGVSILMGCRADFSENESASADSRFIGTRVKSADLDWSIVVGSLACLLITLLMHLFISGDQLFRSIMAFISIGSIMFFLLMRTEVFNDTNHHRRLLLVASATLMFHLLASGGWMLPGVMNSLCVLIGIGFGGRSGWSVNTPIANPNGWTKGLRWLSLAGVVFMMLGLGRSSCIPVLQKSEELNALQSNEGLTREPTHWSHLLQTDTHDPEIARLAAHECVQVLKSRSLSESTRKAWSEAFDNAMAELSRRDPVNWISASECGRWNAMLAEAVLSEDSAGAKTEIGHRRELASKFFSRASELSPNTLSAQLQAAIGSAWCGRVEESSRYLAKVEEIDQRTPHLDRKLGACVVFFPGTLERLLGSLPPEARKNLDEGMARGEPAAKLLRMHVQSQPIPR